ncbi:hypothetical protein NBRC110019_15290 [Neptunitalea chrysea]|uniref:Uncharacterized protein n=1 Tax=Neptunitalea chrysea TaxID=1647581 RepID=A0A9W6EUE1_9FLAO|nr:hypothetical protein [Neptunitalea chrysea]GLB52489.1 hypothetical protein NBRC110019_15290 [Neptunitalea chrysea]
MSVTDVLLNDPEISFLTGTWEWRETKFVDSAAPLLVHYKRLANSKHTYHIHIAANGVILYLKDNEIFNEQEIIEIRKIQNIEANSLLLHVLEDNEPRIIEMQRLYLDDVMNVPYEFPYTKKDNGTYNWFYKVK